MRVKRGRLYSNSVYSHVAPFRRTRVLSLHEPNGYSTRLRACLSTNLPTSIRIGHLFYDTSAGAWVVVITHLFAEFFINVT